MHSTWTKTIGLAALVGVAGLLSGCSDAHDGSGEELGSAQQELAPGSNAAVVSHNIPAAMAPGERLDVQVVMQNTGSAMDGSNTWTPAGYSLYRLFTNWGWTSDPVSTNTPVGANQTFNFVITSPGVPGTYPFGARMRQDVLFGASLNIPGIVVSNATQPRWSCTYVPGSSIVPTTLAPGENRTVTIVVNNSGTATWQASGTYLRSLDSPAGRWGNTSTALTAAVAPAANATFKFNIKAPTTPGSYQLTRQIQNSSIGVFPGECVDVTITVGGAAPLNSALVSENFPLVMAPGESRAVQVQLQNSGTETWTNDGNFRLGSKNSPSSLWGTTLSEVVTATAAGASHAFNFVITAPATPGPYNHRWQMRKVSGTGAGDFGVLIDVPMTVDANAPSQYNAAVVSQDLPTRMTAGENGTFTITMQNTGSAAWTGSSFSLYSLNTPTSLWNLTSSPLGAAETVAANATRAFVLNVRAPATPGSYDSLWRMRWSPGGIGFFGQQASTLGIEVTLCGNNVVDAGEQCDDDNLNNGDGCSDTCQSEVTETFDLATDPAGRTIVGLQSSKALANVAVGDFSGDSASDVVVAQNVTVVPAGMAFRNQAGQVSGYSGTTFFSGGAATLTVYGAEANDSLGAHGTAGIKVGDVTSDGTGDIVVSASGADGLLNAKAGCGEVYVLAGGAGLTGTIDLGATPAPTVLAARVIGAAAGDSLRLLALGDLNDDGVQDLVLGGKATVYVVPGGASLTGDIDLASPPAGVRLITGTAIGGVAAVGNFGGSAAVDLIVSAPSHTHSGLSEAGGAWGFFGPISSSQNLSQANVSWLGTGANDHLGSSLEVADVLGTTANDVLISADQQRKAGLQVGAVNVWAGGIADGTTFNMSTGDVATLTVLGADQYDGLGSAMATGDWNNDGIADIAVAAYTADGPTNALDGAGELTIVLGSRGLPATIDLASFSGALKVYGAGSRDLLGSRQNNVAFGDIDGDGRDDLCVGSPKGGSNGGITDPGRIDCFH